MRVNDCLSDVVLTNERILISFPAAVDLKRLSLSDLQDVAHKLAQEIVFDDKLKAIRMRELFKPIKAKFVLPYLPLAEGSEAIAKRISVSDWPDVLPYSPISAESSQILKEFDIDDWNTFLDLDLWSLLTKSAISMNSIVVLIGEILLSIFVEARDDRSMDNENLVTSESIVATQNGDINDDENEFLVKLALNLVKYENSVAETVSYSVPSSLNVSPSRVLFDRALTRMVDYFFVSGVQDIDEVFKAITDENNNSLEVQYFRNTCKSLRVDDLTQINGDISALVESAYDRLLNGFDLMRVAIVTERILGGNLSTLEQLGNRFDITRERIRQIETQIKVVIIKSILKTEEPVILWVVATLRTQLGNCFKLDCPETQLILDSYLERIDSTKRKAICTMLLEILGRYTFENGWYRQTTQIAVNPTSKEFFEPLLKDSNFVRWDDAVGFIQELEIDDKFIKYIFEDANSYKHLHDWFAIWGGNIGDKCETVLKIIGGSRSVEEMLEFAEEPHSPRGTSNILSEDPRFKRTSLGYWDLASSDRSEYKSIAILIEEYILKNGGNVPVGDVISELVLNNSVKELSIRTYMSTPRFEINSGKISIRKDFKTYPVQTDIESVNSINVLNSFSFEYLLDIDKDILRGSGFMFPEQAAVFLGIYPGDESNFVVDGHHFKVNWRPTSTTGPSCSSMRDFAMKNECVNGDSIVLTFSKKSSNVEFEPKVDRKKWMFARKEKLQNSKSSPKVDLSFQSPKEFVQDFIAPSYSDNKVTITMLITQSILDEDLCTIPIECCNFLEVKPGSTTSYFFEGSELFLNWSNTEDVQPELDGISFMAQEALCSLDSLIAITINKNEKIIEAEEVIEK